MTTFACLPFEQLSVQELYEIMALRQEVFIVEQACPYLDADGKDPHAWHLMGRDRTGRLIAYTRLLPAGISYPEYPSIGRVVTSPSARGTGAGKELMQKSLEWMEKLFPGQPIKIGAQSYLEKFYQNLGFEIAGGEYLEDDIPHVPMLRKAGMP